MECDECYYLAVDGSIDSQNAQLVEVFSFIIEPANQSNDSFAIDGCNAEGIIAVELLHVINDLAVGPFVCVGGLHGSQYSRTRILGYGQGCVMGQKNWNIIVNILHQKKQTLRDVIAFAEFAVSQGQYQGVLVLRLQVRSMTSTLRENTVSIIPPGQLFFLLLFLSISSRWFCRRKLGLFPFKIIVTISPKLFFVIFTGINFEIIFRQRCVFY